MNYYFALIIYADYLSESKKKTKIFLQMSRLLAKTPAQCRTHHHKKLAQISASGKDNLEARLLHKFYYEFYTIRRLDQNYLHLEISNLL